MQGTDGNRADKVLEAIGLACNKNTCPGDKSALRPSGLRFGSPALTSRGLKAADFEKVSDFIDRYFNNYFSIFRYNFCINIFVFRGVELTIKIQNSLGSKATFKDFKQMLYHDPDTSEKVRSLKEEVKNFARSFPLPGLQLL